MEIIVHEDLCFFNSCIADCFLWIESQKWYFGSENMNMLKTGYLVLNFLPKELLQFMLTPTRKL